MLSSDAGDEISTFCPLIAGDEKPPFCPLIARDETPLCFSQPHPTQNISTYLDEQGLLI